MSRTEEASREELGGLPFHRRLGGRVLLFGALPTALVLLTVVGLESVDSYEQLKRDAEALLIDEAFLAAARIEIENRSAVEAADMIRAQQEAGAFGDRPQTMRFLADVLQSVSVVTGTYVSYEPDADGNDAQELATPSVDRVVLDAKGRFVPYVWLDWAKGGAQSLKANVDMEILPYYMAIRVEFDRIGTKEVMVGQPYVYDGQMIVEQSCPIIIDGKFKGIAGVDRALKGIDQKFRELCKRSGSFGLLLSSGSSIKGWERPRSFIAYSGDEVRADEADTKGLLRTQPLADSAFASFAPRFEGKSLGTVFSGADPILGEECFYVAVPIATGNWTLVMGKPISAVMAPIQRQLGRDLAVAGVGLLLVVALLTFPALKTSRKLDQAVRAAQRVAIGDLTEKPSVARVTDEASAMLSAIGAMTDGLNKIVSHVKESTIRINSTATELAATSREQATAAQGLSATSAEIAAALNEISATGAELVTSMERVDKAAQETAVFAREGRSGLAGMDQTMRGFESATTSIASRLAAINERAAAINSVVTTINKVADQTNLLSVNAAIEAEKAGEHGVGFLVVAREIRRLADQTAAATLDIEQMVRQMQGAVSAGVMEMDRFADQVRRGVTEIARIAEQFALIIEQVDAGTDGIRQVTEGMQARTQGVHQIAEAVSQLTTAARSATTASDEFGRAAGDLQNSIAGMRSVVEAFRTEGT